MAASACRTRADVKTERNTHGPQPGWCRCDLGGGMRKFAVVDGDQPGGDECAIRSGEGGLHFAGHFYPDGTLPSETVEIVACRRKGRQQWFARHEFVKTCTSLAHPAGVGKSCSVEHNQSGVYNGQM